MPKFPKLILKKVKHLPYKLNHQHSFEALLGTYKQLEYKVKDS